MTPPAVMVIVWVGALALIAMAAVVMVFCALGGGVLFAASLGHSGLQLAKDIALAMALASLFSWASGAMLLATAAWLIAEAVFRAFSRRLAGES